MLKLLRPIMLIVGVLAVMKYIGLSPIELWNIAKDRVSTFQEDTKQLASGKAIDKVSTQMKSEMKSAEAIQINNDDALSQELQAERTRVMEAKFNALQSPEAIKKISGQKQEDIAGQAIRNAQAAGGDN
ncbi:MAG: hypothetical protein Q8M20_00555 [Rhodocyclaceae bacterium]|nr:hypothetical protein [Rhodocyclaceae bacterium]MDZ4215677.1 hypothetical protein [Rhodocyclaceae bacterium]